MLEPPAATTLADIGNRAVARLIDGVLLALVGLVPILAYSDIQVQQRVFDIPAWVPWVTWGIGLGYEILLTALTGQTIGKRLLGIRVVDATTGALPDLGQAARRAVPSMLGRVPYVGLFSFALYLRVLWHPRRQGAHDALAGTIVIRSSPRPARRDRPLYPSPDG